MRLGKTLLAIRWAKTRADCSRILIACPLSVVESWVRELAEEGQEAIVLKGTTAQKQKIFDKHYSDDFGTRQWFLTNYESFIVSGNKTKEGKPKATPSWLCWLSWDCLIADESTAIRKPKAQVTKIFTRCFKGTRYKAVLSGLPNPESEEDYVTQLLFTHTEFMGCTDYWEWRRKNMIALPTGGWGLKRTSKPKIIEAVTNVALALTREQAGVGSIKMRAMRFVDIPKKVATAIQELNAEYRINNKLTKTVLENMLLEGRLAGGFYEADQSLQHENKLRELAYLINGELRGQALVIWCKHTAEIEGVTAFLNSMRLKLKAVAIHGQTAKSAQKSVALNRANIDLFMAGKIDCIVCQPKSVQMGIDMSRADTAIYYSRWFEYEANAQSSDRIIHPKKKKPVLEIDIIARGTLDFDISTTIADKRVNAKNFNEALFSRIKERIKELPCKPSMREC